MNDIVVKGLRKKFKNIVAVDNVSFSVKKGEIFGLLGVNGAGKTTTINMITGLLKNDSGTIKIFNKDPEKDWEYVKNRTNVSTAYYPLSDVLTVRQNLLIYAKIYGVKNPKNKIKYLLNLFELNHLEDRKVQSLSSGEKTRTALCKGLINDPQILFLDECTIGLDPDIAEKTRKIITQYNKKLGCTILFTSHYMFEVEELCDRIAFMENGKILTIGTAKELKQVIKKYVVEITVKKNIKDLKKFISQKNLDILYSKNNTLILEVSSEKDQVYKLLSRIFAKGFMLDDLHIKKPTLDDIFIKIARKK